MVRRIHKIIPALKESALEIIIIWRQPLSILYYNTQNFCGVDLFKYCWYWATKGFLLVALFSKYGQYKQNIFSYLFFEEDAQPVSNT